MTAPKELSSLPPELAFFTQEVSNRLLALSPTSRPDEVLIAAICLAAELALEIREHSPDILEKFIRSYRAKFRGLH